MIAISKLSMMMLIKTMKTTKRIMVAKGLKLAVNSFALKSPSSSKNPAKRAFGPNFCDEHKVV